MLHKKWDKVSSTRWPATLWPIGTCASNITRSKHKGTTLNTADVTHTITTSSSCYISIRHFWPPSYVSFPPPKNRKMLLFDSYLKGQVALALWVESVEQTGGVAGTVCNKSGGGGGRQFKSKENKTKQERWNGYWWIDAKRGALHINWRGWKKGGGRWDL